MLKASTEGVYFSLHLSLVLVEQTLEMQCLIYTYIQWKEGEGEESAVEFNNAQSLQSLMFMLLFLLIILFMTKDMMKYSAITLSNFCTYFPAQVLLHASLDCLKGTQFLSYVSQIYSSQLFPSWIWTALSSKSEHEKLMKELLSWAVVRSLHPLTQWCISNSTGKALCIEYARISLERSEVGEMKRMGSR